MKYSATLYNDMGHVRITEDKLPYPVRDFVITRMGKYLVFATDTDNLGCRFYILKPNFLDKWTYTIDDTGDEITIDYSGLGKFDPTWMKYV